MKAKKWTDCPVCGAKGSMAAKEGIVQSFKPEGYQPFSVSGLEGFACKVCGEVLLSPDSDKHLDSVIAEELAKQDSKRVVASELAEVDEIAKSLEISRQRVHQMMLEGKIRYVFIGSTKYPIRASLANVKIRGKTKESSLRERGQPSKKVANGS